jgi:hypothetical protein
MFLFCIGLLRAAFAFVFFLLEYLLCIT